MTNPIRIHERHDDSFGFYFEATAVLEQSRSEYQDILVFDTTDHGKIFMLDGLTMLTARTHHVYHEMMAHLPLACVERASAALIIGGGDGGVATELVKAPEMERVVVAELDGAVVDTAKRWFPDVAAGLDDPRVETRIGDGAAFLAAQADAFDLVIIDSTDICDEAHPGDAVASPLATDAFYADLKRALRPGGVAIQMLGSPTFYRRSMSPLLRRLNGLWPHFTPVMVPTPFYITGDWALGLMSVDGDLTPRRAPAPAKELAYFNLAVAAGALALPNDVQRMMEAAP